MRKDRPRHIERVLQPVMIAALLGCASCAHTKAEPRPATAQAWYEKGVGLMSRDKPAALSAFDQALSLSPRHAKAWAHRGTVLLNSGRYDEAIVSYQRARAITPKNVYIYCSLASTYNKMKQSKQAIQAAEQALSLDPKYAPAMLNKAKALTRLGQPQEAAKLRAKALAINPKLKRYVSEQE